MRVLQVLGRSAGGIARHVGDLTENLTSGGVDVEVAAPPDLPVQLPNHTLHVTIPDGIGGHRPAIRALRDKLGDGFDVVHAHGLRAAIDSAVAARGTPIARVATIHNLVQTSIAGRRAVAYRWAEPLAVAASDRVLAVSEEIASSLRAGPGRRWAGRVEVVYLGIGETPTVRRSSEEVRAALGLAPGDRLVVSASRLAPQKALHVLIDALALLPGNVRLAVLGEGPLLDALKTRARDVGVGGRVRFLGFRDDPADHIAAADVFVLSSVWEGIPLSVQEAILLQVPVVATDVGGMPEIVRDGHSGRLVGPGQPGALAEAIAQVLDSEEVARRYTVNALEHLRSTFSTERMMARVMRVYEEVARARAG